MAEIRLSKITKQFSIGLGKLVGFLNEHGIPAEMNPNAKISDEHLPLIEQHFGDDQKLKRDSELVTLKLKEIIEMGSKKRTEYSKLQHQQLISALKRPLLKTQQHLKLTAGKR